MSESGKNPVGVLIAVDGAQFANAVLQVLRTCAPFPIRAAVTGSLDHALSYLALGDVEIALVDATFGAPANQVSIVKIREITTVPTIVFTNSLTRDVEERLRKLGADAVLPRTTIDPITLVETVQHVLEATYNRKYHRPLMNSGRSEGKLVTVSDEAHECVSAFKAWIVGADRLRQVLSDQMIMPEPHRKKLRKLLCKFRTEEEEQ